MGTVLAPEGTAVGDAVAAVRAGVDALLSCDLTAVTGMELAAAVQGLEVQLRRLGAVDARLLIELDARGVAGDFGACSTVDLLRERLRIPAARASARLAAARDTGPRRTLTGEQLPPVYPLLAAAQAAGSVDAEAARRIRHCLDRLPGDLALRHGPSVEADVEAVLVDAATRVDARSLAAVIERVQAHLDPDGQPPREEEIRARRFVDVTTRPDGTGRLVGELTREAAAALAAVLDPLSAPDPAEDGARDSRSAGQRRHDAVLDACNRLLRAGTLPDAGGVPATILLSIDATDLPAAVARDGVGVGDALDQGLPRPPRAGAPGDAPGWASTPAGGLLPLRAALRLADQAEIFSVLRNPAGGILGMSSTRRLATPAQRRALAGRDRGCSFPGCTRPAAWCEAHHIVPWIDGGATTLENLTLLCGFHHREFDRLGWNCRMHPADLVPEWIPPPELDPDQRPRRNSAHDILRL
jgi:hypothetical protein